MVAMKSWTTAGNKEAALVTSIVSQNAPVGNICSTQKRHTGVLE